MPVAKYIDNFSIEQICNSGQCFRMTKQSDGSIEVIAHNRYLQVSQDNNKVVFHCSESDYESIWRTYFDLDTDYGQIISSIDSDDLYLKNASQYGEGIRILNQDIWEMIISFIISQRNNIKRIRTIINRLCEKFGEKETYVDESGNEKIYYSFPKPEVLANADIEDIKSLGVGYRDTYIKKAAIDVVNGTLDLAELSEKDYSEARNELLKLYGVGQKVADCICLFALHHTDAFPMDTHIISIVNKEYNGQFPFEKYKGYAGILQQYMFYYDLEV